MERTPVFVYHRALGSKGITVEPRCVRRGIRLRSMAQLKFSRCCKLWRICLGTEGEKCVCACGRRQSEGSPARSEYRAGSERRFAASLSSNEPRTTAPLL